MRGNVLVRYLLPLLIALPVAFLLLYPQLLRCAQVSQSADFRLLTNAGTGTVYISRQATQKGTARLQVHIKAAHDRIRKFWGDRRGQAILIYCPQQADYERYCVGGEGAGCSLGTPWGTSYLILGPEGNNTDVIAHELCHDELFARLGWWRTKREIPQWFNEGLALMVDYRFSNPTVWEHPDTNSAVSEYDDDLIPFGPQSMIKLTDLETTRDFFGTDYEHVMLAYQTASNEVARWLSVVGRAGVPALAQAVASGENFEEVYRRLERANRTKQKTSRRNK